MNNKEKDLFQIMEEKHTKRNRRNSITKKTLRGGMGALLLTGVALGAATIERNLNKSSEENVSMTLTNTNGLLHENNAYDVSPNKVLVQTVKKDGVLITSISQGIPEGMAKKIEPFLNKSNYSVYATAYLATGENLGIPVTQGSVVNFKTVENGVTVGQNPVIFYEFSNKNSYQPNYEDQIKQGGLVGNVTFNIVGPHSTHSLPEYSFNAN